MFWPNSPFVIATTLAVVIALATAILIWRQRAAPGASYLALAMVAASEWAGSLVLEAAALDIPSKALWSKVEYLGINSSAALVLMFALAYSGNTRWLRFRRLVLLWIVPVLISLTAWTNEWHGLMWSSLTMSPDSNVLLYGHGPAFYLAHASYTLVFILISALLIRAAAHMATLYRLQVAAVALSCVPPWALGILYALRPDLVGGMDVTALGFLLTCLLLNWSLLRFRMFDLVPVARDALIDGMSDGVLVLDGRNRIADVNPAAHRLLGLAGPSPVGQAVTAALAAHPGLAKILEDTPEARAEILLDIDTPLYLDLRISAMPDPQQRCSGRLVVLRDITEMVRMREELRALSLMDELTGLHNRRGFLTLADQELRLAGRLATSVFLLMADVNELKLINDRFGHHEGDHALREVARILKENCRDSDVRARLGGDEFAVLAVGVSADNVEGLEQRLSAAFQSLNSTSGLPYEISVSIGTVLIDPNTRAELEDLLRVADERMYESKRGRVRTSSP